MQTVNCNKKSENVCEMSRELYMVLYFIFLLVQIIHIQPDDDLLKLKHVALYYIINI
jgi:hypothetical protein